MSCTDCLKGICSYCKVYGNEKHPELQLITDLFKEAKYKEKDKNISDKIGKLNTKITSQQKENKDTGIELKAFLDKLIKDGLYNILNNKFAEEGEKLVSICYQLNFLKDNLIFYHKAYLNKENLCMSNNLKQELFWTKKMHMDNLLYLISIKDNIQTKYVVNIEEFKQIIDKYKDEMDKKINLEFGMIKPVEVKKEKEQNLITYENFIEITELKKNE